MNIIACILLLTSLRPNTYTFVLVANTPAKWKNADLFITRIEKGYINRTGNFYIETVLDSNDIVTREKIVDFWNDYTNNAWYNREPIYEYCNGMLVPGIFNGNHQFVPCVGGTVVSMAQYVKAMNAYGLDLHALSTSPGCYADREIEMTDTLRNEPIRRIYNLPGKFVKQKELPNLFPMLKFLKGSAK